jgi:predicted aspartyl protease
MKKYFNGIVLGFLCITCIKCTTNKYLVYNPKHTYQEIDFELIRNQIIFKVNVRGEPLNMMLDTGGNPSLIDTEVGIEFNLIDTTKWGYASGVGTEKIKIYPAKIEDIEIEALQYEYVSSIAMDLSKISERLKVNLFGILGYSFLLDKIIQIDYPAKKMRIYSNETKFITKENSDKYQKFALKFPAEKTIPLIENIKLGNYKGNATLDTGSSLFMDVKSYLMDSIGIDRSKLVKGEGVYGASGEEEVSQIEMNSIKIGAIEIKESKTVTILKEDIVEPNEVGINIGNELLKDFVVTFDYINKIVLIENRI